MKIRIGDLLDLSTIDWHGHTSFMIFCAGCNFRCPFCFNSSLISRESGSEVDLEKIKDRVLECVGFLDALGFTGGEPCLQSKSVIELCNWAKDRKLKTFINTNGSRPEVVNLLMKKDILDYVAIDIKAPLRPEVYGRVSGLGESAEGVVENVKKTLELCREGGLDVEARTTIVPGLIDNEDHIREIARSVKDCTVYVIQEFYNSEEVLDKQLRTVRSPSRDFLVKLASSALEQGVKEVYIRTRERGMERVSP